MKVSVFQPPEGGIAPPTKSDRELFYNDMTRESPSDAKHHDLFYEMEMDMMKPPTSTIPSVLASYALNYFVPVHGNTSLFRIPVSRDKSTRIVRLIKGKKGIEKKYFTVQGTFEISGFMTEEIGNIQDTSQFEGSNISTGSFGMMTDRGTFTGAASQSSGKISFRGNAPSVVLFKDKQDAVKKIQLLIQHVTAMKEFFNIHFSSVQPKGIKVTREFTKTARQTTKRLELEKIIGSLRGMSDLDVQQILVSEGMPNIYHQSMFDKRAIEKRLHQMTKQEMRKEQKLTEMTEFIVRCAKEVIALEKFGPNLTPKQKRIVDAEYERRQKVSNPNTKLGDDLHKSFTKNIGAVAAALREVKKLGIKSDSVHDFIVCPHVVRRAEEVVKTRQLSDISQSVIREFASSETAGGYFCKICGEKLSGLDSTETVLFLNGVRVQSIKIDDELRSSIWKEATRIIQGFVRFSEMVNTKAIIASITDAVLPEVSKVIAAMEKIRTNSAQNIIDMTYINISVYIMATVIRMIFISPGASFARRVTVGGAPTPAKKTAPTPSKKTAPKGVQGKRKQKNTLQGLFDTGIEIINKIRKQNIDAVPGMSSGIKPMLIKAFRWVLQLKISSVSSTSEFQVEGMMVDFVFNEHMMEWFETKKGGRPERKDTKRYLGRNMEELKEDAKRGVSIFDTAVMPKTSSRNAESVFALLTGKFGSVVPMDPNILAFYEKYHDNTEPPVKVVTTRSFGEDDRSRWMDTVTKKNVNIGKYYCDTGEPHNFSVYLMKKGKKTANLTAKQIDKKLYEGDSGWSFVDVKCSKCDVYLSKARPGNIYDAIDSMDRKSAFYEYYSTKCPEGGVHNMTKGKCKKCGFSGESPTYFKKYKSKYEDSKKRSLPAKHIPIIPKTVKFPEWKTINTNILELSKLVGVKYNVLINLGLNEGKKFESIKNESENRNNDVDERMAAHRNWYIIGYAMKMFNIYYTAKNHKNVFKLPLGLDRLFAVLRKDPVLPDIYNDFNEKVRFYSKDPIKCTNFMLDFIGVSLVGIVKSMKTPEEKKFGTGLAKHIVKSIIADEATVSKQAEEKIKVMTTKEEHTVEEVVDQVEEKDNPVSLDSLDINPDDIENMEGSVEL